MKHKIVFLMGLLFFGNLVQPIDLDVNNAKSSEDSGEEKSFTDKAKEMGNRALDKAREYALRTRQLGEKGVMHVEKLGNRLSLKARIITEKGFNLFKDDNESQKKAREKLANSQKNESDAMTRRHNRERTQLQEQLQQKKAQSTLDADFDQAVQMQNLDDSDMDNGGKDSDDSNGTSDKNSNVQESHELGTKEYFIDQLKDLDVDQEDKKILAEMFSNIHIERDELWEGNLLKAKELKEVTSKAINEFSERPALREVLRDEKVQQFLKIKEAKVPQSIQDVIEEEVKKTVKDKRQSQLIILSVIGFIALDIIDNI